MMMSHDRLHLGEEVGQPQQATGQGQYNVNGVELQA